MAEFFDFNDNFFNIYDGINYDDIKVLGMNVLCLILILIDSTECYVTYI